MITETVRNEPVAMDAIDIEGRAKRALALAEMLMLESPNAMVDPLGAANIFRWIIDGKDHATPTSVAKARAESFGACSRAGIALVCWGIEARRADGQKR